KGEGNWIHIKYTNHIHANQAIGRNGKIFMNNHMVGVKKREFEVGFNPDCSVMKSAAFTHSGWTDFNSNKNKIPRVNKSLVKYRYSRQNKGMIERMFNLIFG
ncbi:MAG: Nucleoporin nup35, partial [Paramarteilia canceri]